MHFTLADIDSAVVAILGASRVKEMRNALISRLRIMELAAATCFLEERPDDDHSRVLRAAMRQVNCIASASDNYRYNPSLINS